MTWSDWTDRCLLQRYTDAYCEEPRDYCLTKQLYDEILRRMEGTKPDQDRCGACTITINIDLGNGKQP